MANTPTPLAEIPADYARYVGRKEAASILSVSLRTLDRLDADDSPKRTFPRSRRFDGRRRKWLLFDLIKWAEQQWGFSGGNYPGTAA